jgi:hypothetical protein
MVTKSLQSIGSTLKSMSDIVMGIRRPWEEMSEGEGEGEGFERHNPSLDT